ncbi:hypothetical protein PU630_15465 [Microbacterium horticulturae]|uniref:Uncharacterized protein n=1 Tax=Microbacterium horticulturae TaxID=3028316 RepID=A0ABY8C1A7_9MICO|nr:hypothetical protein [Microbacterium sp. KACC 23027]WEG08623.1 hypothetical protein PU630_15465 [Microbacterium sp. KACC 23027]
MTDLPFTERSPTGTYYVITRSRSVYEVITDPDRAPRVTRYRVGENAMLLDGQPLTGVRGFSFDSVTGNGEVLWWKDNIEDRDDPGDGIYTGTRRRTSDVVLVVQVESEMTSIAPPGRPSEWPSDVVRRIRDEGAGAPVDRIRLAFSDLDLPLVEADFDRAAWGLDV